MKKILIFTLALVAVLGKLVNKEIGQSPRTEQSCLSTASTWEEGWFWDSTGGHCEYCYQYCNQCSPAYNTCSSCKKNYGSYETDSESEKVTRCQRCGSDSKIYSKISDCCWNDRNHSYGFHVRPGSCINGSVQFGHYCMDAIDGCEQYSSEDYSQHKDSVGYTRCYKCKDGYHLNNKYECDKCKHIDWTYLSKNLDKQLIPKEIDNKPEIFKIADVDGTYDTSKPINMDKCAQCNGQGQCRKCVRGYFMATNYQRQTFDQNIARNPSSCRKCKEKDQIHDAGATSDKCACSCTLANDRCTDCSQLVGSNEVKERCWQDKDQSYACRPCSDIKFKESSGIEIKNGRQCLTCKPLSNQYYCETCEDGAKSYPIYDKSTNKQHGVICLEGRAPAKGTAYQYNPSLEGLASDSTSSPTSLQLNYDTSKELEIARATKFQPSTDTKVITKEERWKYYFQAKHMTVTDCNQVKWSSVTRNADDTGDMDFSIHYPSCEEQKCDNGYTPVKKTFQFKESTGDKFKEVTIIICRRCRDVIAERDQEYLGTQEMAKWVRRCETEDINNPDKKKYRITQCAYSTDDELTKYSTYPTDTLPSDKDENWYRGQYKWYRFYLYETVTHTRQLEDMYYLVTGGSNSEYNSYTYCVKNEKKCQQIKLPELGDKTGKTALKHVYDELKSNPYCETCYDKDNTPYSGLYIKTNANTCVLCTENDSNIPKGCTKCEKDPTDKSDKIICVECRNNNEAIFWKKTGTEIWEYGYETSDTIIESQRNYFQKVEDGKKVSCTGYDKYCKNLDQNNEGICTTCQPYYRLSDSDKKKCEPCYDSNNSSTTAHCKSCPKGVLECEACSDGYVLHTLSRSSVKICEKCDHGCIECSKSTSGRKTCIKCDSSNYYLANGSCQIKRLGCTSQFQPNGECTICQYGYTLINDGWCYDCVRQQYAAQGSTSPDSLDGSYSKYKDVHGFVFCNWSTSCHTPSTVAEWTNVRRDPKTPTRILELLDDIFE